MEIDYALASQFVDTDGRPRQLRFISETPELQGQLVATIADVNRADNHDTVAITRPHVAFDEIERALDDWQNWATIARGIVSLAAIRKRIHDAGLD
jgi:hypothetical protein